MSDVHHEVSEELGRFLSDHINGATVFTVELYERVRKAHRKFFPKEEEVSPEVVKQILERKNASKEPQCEVLQNVDNSRTTRKVTITRSRRHRAFCRH